MINISDITDPINIKHSVQAPYDKNTSSANFKKWFGTSKVVDDEGYPLVVYHASTTPFNSIKPSIRVDVGAHFGNQQSASVIGDAHPESAKFYPVYLRIETPLEFVDPISWDIDSMGEFLVEKGIVSLNAYKSFSGIWNREHNKWMDIRLTNKNHPPTEGMRRVQNFVMTSIKNKGYDGLIYVNRAELSESDLDRMTGHDFSSPNSEFLDKFESSSWSYCIFDSNQAKSVHNRGGWSLTSDNLSEAVLSKKEQALELARTMIPSEIVRYDWDELAFGFTEGDTIKVDTALLIPENQDMLNVRGQNMYAYFKGTPFEGLPFIEVSYKKGQFHIEDGHHRYGYAKLLKKKQVPVLVTKIFENPFIALGFSSVDEVINGSR